MNFPTKEQTAAYRRQYPAGLRVELVQMNDPYTRLRPGDRGRVTVVDDAGGVHIAWDSGSGLAAVIGEDIIKPVMQDFVCLHCEARFRGTISVDDLGAHTVCPECEGSFVADEEGGPQ